MRACRIAITAAKGGVGKSTTAINLAHYLSTDQKCRVLLVDTDSQSSTSQFFLPPEVVDNLSTDQTVAAVYDPSLVAEPEKAIHKTPFDNLDFMPASDRLERFNLPEPHRTGELQLAMREFLDEAARPYDFVVFDTPPLMASLQTWGCLLASHFVLTPLVMESFAIQAIAKVDRMIAAAAEHNPELAFLGYVVNLRDKRRAIQTHNEEKLRAVHGERVLDTVVTNLTAFSEAQAFRQPITAYAKSGDAVKITRTLCREVCGRIHKQMTARQNRRDASGNQNQRRAA